MFSSPHPASGPFPAILECNRIWGKNDQDSTQGSDYYRKIDRYRARIILKNQAVQHFCHVSLAQDLKHCASWQEKTWCVWQQVFRKNLQYQVAALCKAQSTRQKHFTWLLPKSINKREKKQMAWSSKQDLTTQKERIFIWNERTDTNEMGPIWTNSY